MIIWDINIRIFHFLLIIFMILTITSAKLNLLIFHQYFGVTFIGLLIFRLLWGFFGSTYSKFKNLIYSPREIYLFMKGETIQKRGHNVLGFFSILSFYMTILVLSITGLFSSDDIFFDGPLVFLTPNLTGQWTKLHNFFHYVIYFLIIIHIFAILFYQFFKNTKLINQMIDGISRDKNVIIKNTPKSLIIYGFILLIFCLISPAWIIFVFFN